MDYAKFAYLKATELESYNQAITSTKLSAANALEFVEPVLNMYVASVGDISCGTINIFGSTIFQDKIIVKSTLAGKASFEILVDDVSVLTEEREITIGENQVILLKAYDPPKLGTAKITLRIKASHNFACTVTSNTMAIWGMVADANSIQNVEMRTFTYDDELWISYAEKEKIFLTKTTFASQSLLPSQFSEVASGVSHSFAQDKNGEVYFFRVDASGNLFYKRFNITESEVKIDDGVSVCYARVCPDTCTEDILICYIKNGVPCYKCMTSGVVGSRRLLDVPAGKYVNISIANASLNRMFVICTHSNFSNYILYSTEDNDLSKFVCSLNASAFMVAKRYVRMGDYSQICPILSASVGFSLETSYLNYQELFNNKITEHLLMGTKIYASPYEIEQTPTYNYTLMVDQLKSSKDFATGEYRVKYLDDCEDWSPATLNLSKNSTINDPSQILEKWPFTEIKPCLLKDGELVGYLNPKNYKKFIDGTTAPVTNPEYHVMVEFPKIYCKFTTDWDGERVNSTRSILTVNICNKPKKGYVCNSHVKAGVEYDKIYISAYKSQLNEGQIYSYSGLLCNSTEDHRNISQYLSTAFQGQYTPFGINTMTMLIVLQMLLFANLDGSKVIGYSPYRNSSVKITAAGAGDAMGMYHGRTTLNPLNYNIKTFGLENIVGGARTMLDGFFTDDDFKVYVYNPHNPDCKLMYTTDNYLCYDFNYEVVDSRYYMGYITMYYADNNCGIIPLKLENSNRNINLSYGYIASSGYYDYVDKDDYPVMDYMFGNDILSPTCYGMCDFLNNYQINPGQTVMGDRFIYYPKNLISK